MSCGVASPSGLILHPSSFILQRVPYGDCPAPERETA